MSTPFVVPMSLRVARDVYGWLSQGSCGWGLGLMPGQVVVPLRAVGDAPPELLAWLTQVLATHAFGRMALGYGVPSSAVLEIVAAANALLAQQLPSMQVRVTEGLWREAPFEAAREALEQQIRCRPGSWVMPEPEELFCCPPELQW